MLVASQPTSFWLADSGLDPKRFSNPPNVARRAGTGGTERHSSSAVAGTSGGASEIAAGLGFLLMLLLLSPLAAPGVAPFSLSSLKASRHRPSNERSFKVCPLSVSLSSSRLQRGEEGEVEEQEMGNVAKGWSIEARLRLYTGRTEHERVRRLRQV